MYMESLRKRNVSDGDSGFDSALSSRSSSISLEESQELSDFKVSKVEIKETFSPLREKFLDILDQQEDIFQDVSTADLYIIKDRVTGRETQYKPPSRLKFNTNPQVEETYSRSEYNRSNPIPRSQLFSSRLQLELEKQVAKMDLVEVDLVMDASLVPPPSLGIRVIGVNMIHGVPDKLNIYVKRILEGSVAGMDTRIKINDHIVEVNGTSLVGVSQKVAADALSSCAVNPETGLVHFTLARERDACKAEEPAMATESEKATAARENPPAATRKIRENSPAAVKMPANCSPAVAGELTPAVITGAATSFMPVAQQKRLFNPPTSLSELPAPLIVKIAGHLAPRDRVSLTLVNKSFYQALNGDDTVLPARGPDTSPAAALSPNGGPDITAPPDRNHPCGADDGVPTVDTSPVRLKPVIDTPKVVVGSAGSGGGAPVLAF